MADELPQAIDPRSYVGETPSFGGFAADRLCRSLESLALDGHPSGELRAYAHEDGERFLRTIDMIPPGVAKALEIGANPYFTTTLLRWLRPEIAVTATNYFGNDGMAGAQSVRVAHPSGSIDEFRQAYVEVNVEAGRFPFDDEAFDCVLFCEVLEHMTNDPVAALFEIWRVLRPGGCLILTTPNVARLENVARALAGSNLYDPYSGYGPYGRHNREYTRHETVHLLQHCGFAPDLHFTADVRPNRAADIFPKLERLSDLLAHRGPDLGHYIFARAEKAGRPNPLRPSWLYRSLPEEMIAQSPI
ncbi:class I SAM-dependent methyltransferase [Novosphingobium aquimarinum]|uniref:class I SAM-dependent methyltransferase n=1 Tax=Novosphingobium aquimarinum TaxID=2682494 RepID=UPI0018DDA455|nr:class I SAM-dependent methyltransferase [Novosphingobium aquimarinum]